MIAKFLTSAGAAALLLALGACGPTATTSTDATSSAPETTAPAPVIAPISPADFVTKVAMSDMYEIQASQLAVRRAGNAQIRAFARTMVTDHTATSTQLRGIVRGHDDLPLPTALDTDHQNLLDDLTHASAADFDQKYIDQQTHAHDDAEHLLTDYSQNGANTDLRSFATETAPKVQHHLDMVRALDHSGADEPSAAHN